MDKCLIFGAGGHARVIADVMRRRGRFQVAAFVVAGGSREQGRASGLRLVSESEAVGMGIGLGFLAVGDNYLRRSIRERLAGIMPNLTFVNVIDPTAVVGDDVRLGGGVFIGPGAIVNTGSQIGEHVILNTASIVEHDCKLGEFSSLGPGAILGGAVEIGSNAHIGIGAVIREQLKIGENSIVGGGANVTGDLGGNLVAFGNPARAIRSFTPGDKYLGYRGK